MALNELYGTHQEAIHWALNKLATKDLKIYELGAGHFSTQLLHNATTNKLVTIETDLEWLKMFRLLESSTSSPTSPIHEFIYIDPYSWAHRLANLDLTCDLCFIDSFDGPSRVIAMNLFKDFAKLVVVHDQENVFENPKACYEGQYEAVTSYKYCKKFEKSRIITVVLSNSITL